MEYSASGIIVSALVCWVKARMFMANLSEKTTIMIPAFVTPVGLLLRRITFICSACIGLALSGCDFDLPNQDACTNIYANKLSSESVLRFEPFRRYDTIISTLTCVLHLNSKTANKGKLLFYLYNNHKEIRHVKSEKGQVEFGWIPEGMYDLQVGSPSQYPCFNIYHIHIPGGSGCILHIYQTTQYAK